MKRFNHSESFLFVTVLERSRSSNKQDANKPGQENRPDFCDLLFSNITLTVFYDLKKEKKTLV